MTLHPELLSGTLVDHNSTSIQQTNQDRSYLLQQMNLASPKANHREIPLNVCEDYHLNEHYLSVCVTFRQIKTQQFAVIRTPLRFVHEASFGVKNDRPEVERKSIWPIRRPLVSCVLT
jgi:hypothetical protein